MLIQSAIDFNVTVKALDPSPKAPCSGIADEFVSGSLTDYDTVFNFGKDCDLLTIEIENVNTEALKDLRDKLGKKVYPQPEVVELIKDKVIQKKFYKKRNIPTSPFYEVNGRQEVMEHSEFLPMVNKLAREGYDGRGVQVIKTPEDLSKAFDKHGLVEKFIAFEKEIAVIVARSETGEVSTFPAVELAFHPEANLVEFLFSPADIPSEIAENASTIAKNVIEELEMVGLLAVEMFVTKEGQVLVNEIAPRPHNSGHQTIEANVTSQYEQHLRAILGMPLGDTSVLVPSAMINLLGEEGHTGEVLCEGIEEVLATKGTHIHLYGKKETKPFRKMGHVTVTDNDMERLRKKARFVKDTLKIKSI